MERGELLESGRCVVVAIDLQGKLMELVQRPQLVIDATQRLFQLAEIFHIPVLLTEQYPDGLGPTHPDLRASFDSLTVPTGYVSKTSFSCAGEPRFESELQRLRPDLEPGDRQIVVAGIETHVCVMQTVLDLLRDGATVHVAWDCVSSRGEEYRRHALERIAQAGARVTNHESIGFEWARDKKHPGFRAMSELFRQGQPG